MRTRIVDRGKALDGRIEDIEANRERQDDRDEHWDWIDADGTADDRLEEQAELLDWIKQNKTKASDHEDSDGTENDRDDD